MDQKSLRALEARCTQEEPPPCQAGCPLGVDARGFHKEMGKKRYSAARKILEKHMPLSSIVARLCEGPCRSFCHRKELGGSINTPDLEKFCIENTTSKTRILPLPPKPKKIAIIGSGPDGLTAGFDLIKKGYQVHIYHLEEGPGSWLINHKLLDQEILAGEIATLTRLGVSFIEVPRLDTTTIPLENYHAFFLSDDCEDFLQDTQSPDSETGLIKDGWFRSPFLQSEFPFIYSIAGGRLAALSIDRFLQGASLTASRVPLRHGKTELFVNTSSIETQPLVIPKTTSAYTEEEAQTEAQRCIDCQCLECVKNCVYLQEYKSFPKTYARRIYNNSAIVKGNHQANKMINSCSLCGQCEEVCPNDFSMADLCLEARQIMVKEDRMPPSAQHFALEEMRSATTDSQLICHGKGQKESKSLFFPGCQLAGIRPEQSSALYDLLLANEPQTGIWLDCCGAPLHWSGRKDEFSRYSSDFIEKWRAMGEPQIITACSSCQHIFENFLRDEQGNTVQPQITSAWEIVAQNHIESIGEGRLLAVSDPCTARHNHKIQEAVRAITIKAGYRLSPLPASREMTECCGFGGMMESCNQELSAKVLKERAQQSDDSFLTYCAMCRDQIAKTGKEVYHILDLLFPKIATSADAPAVTLSSRRNNRRKLQSSLQQQSLGTIDPVPAWQQLHLHINDEVATLLETRRILIDDLKKTLHHTRPLGRYFENGKGTTRICYHTLGSVTFWIQYREDNGIHIESAWSHRMTITGGSQ